ncbi:peroxiredoxin Q/BCP [Algoriphagus ratkowskyi]|uniref:thioredoxin-dependent peroxiredoxin n=2 Tax=Algoriphagus ratkowskyi TaxID=57028 RepID=A0A2W7R5T1_9BACT|nr:peroxiredoxin [Algoriphagus ratkowskyi]PZX55501.1 peroxiredoxin Q/BCP [Algoriphagus ratkowskyi]
MHIEPFYNLLVVQFMALKIGSIAPNFDLKSTGEKSSVSSTDLKGKEFILYFYPKDFTPGCTAEACEFRDQFEAFRELDIPIFGISKDTILTHERFKKEHKLPFELLSDPNGEVCKAYDALIPLIRMPKRVTYFIDKDYKIAAVFSDMFESKRHIEAMLGSLVE